MTNNNYKIFYARALAKGAILFERLSEKTWRSLAWAGFFAGLWLFEIPAVFGNAGEIAAFFAFFAGLAYFHYNDLRFLCWPLRAEAERRIERDAALPHRPFDALNDRLSIPENPAARSLWRMGQARAARALKKIKIAPPGAELARSDPYAVRFAVLLFLSAGLLSAGADSLPRLKRGLTPFGALKSGYLESSLRVEITPPAYTGLAPLALDSSNRGQSFSIPEGSTLKAFARGGMGRPYFIDDKSSRPFKDAGDGNYALETPVPRAPWIAVTRLLVFRTSWNIKTVPDSPPRITAAAPEVQPDGSMRFPLTVKDDYGARTVTMRMELGDISVASPTGAPVSETRSVMSPPGKPIDITPAYDLTGHAWAGLPVKFIFTAEDAAGHKTDSAPIKITLPERRFTHPVAQTLAALRKRLLTDPLSDYVPIRAQIESVISHPEKFGGDFVIALGLRSASSRLYWAGRAEKTAAEVAALLWDIARQIEDGDLPRAAETLRQAKANLEDALKNPALTNEEIARRMDALRRAMAEYMQALAQDLRRRAASGEDITLISPEMAQAMKNPGEMDAMLGQIESLLKAGDRDAARKLLSEMQNMMDNLKPGSFKTPPDLKAMMEAARKIQALTERQQKTLEQARAGKSLYDEQEAIRHDLGAAMLALADATHSIPESLANAEQEMRKSSAALKDGHAGDSIPAQEKTLEYLKESKQELSEKMMAKLQSMMSMAMGGAKLDPLGRPYGGDNGGALFPGSSVKIPDEAQRKQAQEILRLLQKRSGELERPAEELDYYRRLLRRF